MSLNKVEIQIDAVFSFGFSFDITSVVKDWEIVNGDNIYLSVPYLKALQNSKIPFTDFIYVILYKNREPLGVVYFQRVALNNTLLGQEKFPDKINRKIQSKILQYTKSNLLVCGNFLATGVHGYFFKDTQLEKQLPVIIKKLTLCLKKQNKSVNMVLFKEFWMDENPLLQQEVKKEYEGFQIDVNMILNIHPLWSNFDEYLAFMSTKYRTRAKSTLKKTKELIGREFFSEDILGNKKEIDELFQRVLKTSSFNVIQPNATFFYQLKLALGEQFVFKGYFFHDKLVAFSVATFNHKYLDANYVGIDYDVNNTLPIYQRLLYDYVDLAIKKQVNQLRLGRTAEIMKSSLGAVPVEMNLYIKHTQFLLHKILKPALHNVQPSLFEIRKPFKN